ncbi:FHA domain-containing protein [Mucilaginibacter agri]|uniref:FHA domain-containing protein n=1 Tax=Mucilaginibacter agri TaxID=2695265 RepID=A0A965ZMH4_9SPHI|nr:FHA domain-containing protein [Mucilaginibacter agri]NCD72421.1 FHA domain-containing protein [Mucilaginibacter agri]
MFNLFKRKEDNTPKDVKALRDALLRFIKVELQKSEGGEGRNIKGIHLFFLTNPAEKHIFESVVYATEPMRFKDEVQRIADDFALGLPEDWEMAVSYEDALPMDAIKVPDIDASIFIRTKENTVQKTGSAYIRVLSGEAEQEEYHITSEVTKYNIGREKEVQVKDGFFRHNHIAFPGNSANESNKYISRQHAHIEWSPEHGCFILFGDEGGVPPQNKIKIKQSDNDSLIKLNAIQIGHKLQEGDQIILGDSAVIRFSYNSEALNELNTSG